MKNSINGKNGFTVIEMVVSIAIISTISSVFLANYHGANKKAALTMSAQKIAANARMVQNNSLGLVDFGSGPPSGGWGIYFNTATSTKYFLYADVNNNHKYDGPAETFQIIDLAPGVSLKNIDGITGERSVTFYPPDPDTYIQGVSYAVANKYASTFITLTDDTNSIKRVYFNYFGLISVN